MPPPRHAPGDGASLARICGPGQYVPGRTGCQEGRRAAVAVASLRGRGEQLGLAWVENSLRLEANAGCCGSG